MNTVTTTGADVVQLLVLKLGKERRIQNKKLMKKYPKKVRIKIRKYFIAIGFNKDFLPWMHKKLKIKEPSYKNVLKGDRVLYIDFKTEKCYLRFDIF